MACRKRPSLSKRSAPKRQSDAKRRQNKTIFRALLEWLIPQDTLFTKDRFHGNINWTPEQLASQAVIWSWQDARNVTDAFAVTAEICEDLGMDRVAKNYTTFMDALDRYRMVFRLRLGQRSQRLAEEVAGRFWRDGDWVLIGFDGSRVSAPRTVSNEKEFCAPNYGQGQPRSTVRRKPKGCAAAKTRETSRGPKSLRRGSR